MEGGLEGTERASTPQPTQLTPAMRPMPPPRNGSITPLRIVLLLIAGAGAIGTFLPWGGIGGLMMVDGTAGDGWVTLALFAIALALSAGAGDRSKAPSLGIGIGIVFVALLAAFIAAFDFSAIRIVATAGSGLYLVMVAGVALALLAGFGTRSTLGILASFVVVATILAGSFHLVSGRGTGSGKVCAKPMWSLKDTIVDADDYIGKRIDLDNAFVVRGLIDCGVLHIETSEPPPEPKVQRPTQPEWGYCSVNGERGTCIEDYRCEGQRYVGYCQGPDNIQCCLR